MVVIRRHPLPLPSLSFFVLTACKLARWRVWSSSCHAAPRGVLRGAARYRRAHISIRKQCPLFGGGDDVRRGPIKQARHSGARVFVYFGRLTRSRRSATSGRTDQTTDARRGRSPIDRCRRVSETEEPSPQQLEAIAAIQTTVLSVIGACSGRRDRTLTLNALSTLADNATDLGLTLTSEMFWRGIRVQPTGPNSDGSTNRTLYGLHWGGVDWKCGNEKC